MVSERRQRLKYIIGDFISSHLAWFFYNCIRYSMKTAILGTYSSLGDFLTSPGVVLGQVFFPLFMMAVYATSGYYNEVFRKSRLQEFFITFWSALVNMLFIFFLALINDVTRARSYNYEMMLILLCLLFFCVYLVRCLITSHSSHCIKNRKWSFPTLIIGHGTEAVAFVNKLERMKEFMGYKVEGFVGIPGETGVETSTLPVYDIDDIEQVCRERNISDLIVVPTMRDNKIIMQSINRLFALGCHIQITPDDTNVLLSQVRINDLHGLPLVDISGSNMSEAQKNIKRLLDIVMSLGAMIVLLPLYLAVAIAIKLDSEGPVLYLQERVGYHNVPFRIIKFRSMRQNAESNNVPQLTQDDDPRVTRVGRFLRKYRIDELPQFFNVLRGEMSIVGPRPERQYYVDQIQKRVPSYALLHQVRPGITSMGMVKFGYAQNVDEMVERLTYDLLYLENMSLINDFKIMVYTVKIVFTGRGM